MSQCACVCVCVCACVCVCVCVRARSRASSGHLRVAGAILSLSPPSRYPYPCAQIAMNLSNYFSPVSEERERESTRAHTRAFLFASTRQPLTRNTHSHPYLYTPIDPLDTPHSPTFAITAYSTTPIRSPALTHPHSPLTLQTALLLHSHTPTTPPHTPISYCRSLSLDLRNDHAVPRPRGVNIKTDAIPRS